MTKPLLQVAVFVLLSLINNDHNIPLNQTLQVIILFCKFSVYNFNYALKGYMGSYPHVQNEADSQVRLAAFSLLRVDLVDHECDHKKNERVNTRIIPNDEIMHGSSYRTQGEMRPSLLTSCTMSGMTQC